MGLFQRKATYEELVRTKREIYESIWGMKKVDAGRLDDQCIQQAKREAYKTCGEVCTGLATGSMSCLQAANAFEDAAAAMKLLLAKV